jgi:hypothetical protein
MTDSEKQLLLIKLIINGKGCHDIRCGEACPFSTPHNNEDCDYLFEQHIPYIPQESIIVN